MLKIEVSALHPDEAKGLSIPQQVEMALSGIGFMRHALAAVGVVAPTQSISSTDDPEPGDEQTEAKADAAPAGAPKRRGRPPKAAETAPAAETKAAEPAPAAPVEPVAPDAPQISINPEDRVDPAQALTHEDLRSALGRLAQKIGLPAAVAEVKTLVGGGIAEVENTQEALRAVLDRMEARIAGGPAMTPLAAEPAAAPAAEAPKAPTIDDVKAAIVAYAKKFGGDAAKADRPMLIGFEGRVDDMPADIVQKAVTALRDAVEANPFGRTVVA